VRHMAIVLRVIYLFELKGTGPLYQLSPEASDRFELFRDMDVLFPSTLEGQECALAYLENMVHLFQIPRGRGGCRLPTLSASPTSTTPSSRPAWPTHSTSSSCAQSAASSHVD